MLGFDTLGEASVGSLNEKKIACAPGAFSLTGFAASFNYYVLQAAKATFSVQGKTAELTPSAKLLFGGTGEFLVEAADRVHRYWRLLLRLFTKFIGPLAISVGINRNEHDFSP